MYIIKLFTFLFVGTSLLSTLPQEDKVSFSYMLTEDSIHFQVQSNYHGWVAIAINTEEKLSGSNLIMGAYEYEFFKMSDRYIVSNGVHKSVLELGVNEAIFNRSVEENQNGTTMTFSLLRNVKDTYHKQLISGNQYTIHLAASTSDDFNHHSIIRFSQKITL